MHEILFSESFSFCSRNDLEFIQPVSQSLLDIIVAGSKTLPLRPIQRVHMDFDEKTKDKIHIYVEEGDEPDYEASVCDGDFADTLLRLQHTCEKIFCVGICDSPFLSFWKAQEAALFTVACIYFEPPETKDFDLTDSIVNHFRPREIAAFEVEESSWHENGDNSEYVKVLARDSFLANLQTCRLTFLTIPIHPDSWSFDRDGCSNKKLESVCIGWNDIGTEQSPAPKLLNKPRKTEMPPPKAEMIMWSIPEVHQVSQSEMHSFIDKKHWKRTDVYKWTVKYERFYGRITTHILQCRVENL